jgi:hypothetical protein
LISGSVVTRQAAARDRPDAGLPLQAAAAHGKLELSRR